MTGRRTIVGLCLICALAFSALAAQGASAVPKGTTAFTCSSSAESKTFLTDHCNESDGAGSEFGHVTFAGSTELSATNAGTDPTLLHAVISGVEVELESTEVKGTGSMENMQDAGTGEHTANGTGTLEYKNVTVVKPEGKGCKVKTGEVKTKLLKATTAGQEGSLKFQPNEGTTFAELKLEGCSIPALNVPFSITGSIKGTPKGATVVFTPVETTEQNTLRLGGQEAGYSGKLTLSGRTGGAGPFTPLAATTEGTTAFTCKEKKEPGGAGFSGAHCTASDAVETGAKYEHVAIAENTTTEGLITSTTTGAGTSVAKLKAVVSGINFELQATETVGNVAFANKKSETNGGHFVEWTGSTLYSGVTVAAPAGKGCKVTGGELKTNELRGTTAFQGMGGKLEPAAGEAFAEFNIEGCGPTEALKALNGVYKVTGSVNCAGDGATALCSHTATTAQGTLKMRGQKAGVEVTTTITSRADGSESFTPLGTTTTGTP